MRRTWVIVRKEWAEVFKSPMVLWTVVGTPVVLLGTAGASLALVFTSDDPLKPEDAQELMALGGAACAGITDPLTCLEVWIGALMLQVLMLLPAILPGVFAAYSVVGEKTGRTLEPLLATPIHRWELLLGKCVAALVPALVGTGVAVAAFYALVLGLGSRETFRALTTPAWLAMVLVVGPLIAVVATQLAIIVSSRVEDPRVAQQLAGLVVLPLVVVMSAQSFGFFAVSPTTVGVAVVAFAGLAALTTFMAVELFDREAILTRWR